MAVADLHKAEFTFHRHNLSADDLVHAIRLQHTAVEGPQHASAGPGHAFQETAAVDAVVVVIVNDFILHWFVRSSLRALFAFHHVRPPAATVIPNKVRRE